MGGLRGSILTSTREAGVKDVNTKISVAAEETVELARISASSATWEVVVVVTSMRDDDILMEVRLRVRKVRKLRNSNVGGGGSSGGDWRS